MIYLHFCDNIINPLHASCITTTRMTLWLEVFPCPSLYRFDDVSYRMDRIRFTWIKKTYIPMTMSAKSHTFYRRRRYFCSKKIFQADANCWVGRGNWSCWSSGFLSGWSWRSLAGQAPSLLVDLVPLHWCRAALAVRGVKAATTARNRCQNSSGSRLHGCCRKGNSQSGCLYRKACCHESGSGESQSRENCSGRGVAEKAGAEKAGPPRRMKPRELTKR